MIRGVNEVAQEATTTARNIVQLREKHRDIIATNFSRSAGPAYQLLEYLYERPIITVNSVVKVTGLSYANANRLMMKFQEHHLVHRMDEYQRNRRFVYTDYLTLFSGEEMPKKDNKLSLEPS
jgi:Fic family protein